MRVISGMCRGTKLFSVEGDNTRPTTDRIKETLFNIINPYLRDCIFLDLFSGTGSIGIEALSRGASHCVFVDNQKIAVDIIYKNLEKTKLQDKATVLKSDVFSVITNKKFDIIFMDPPYKYEVIRDVLLFIDKNNMLNDEGIIVCEMSSQNEIPETNVFKPYKIKEYKTTKMVFYKKGDRNE